MELTGDVRQVMHDLSVWDPQYNLAGEYNVWIAKASNSSKVGCVEHTSDFTSTSERLVCMCACMRACVCVHFGNIL